MANNSNPEPKESGKPKAISARVWVLLGVTALFFLVALFAIAFVVTRSFQNKEIAAARPTASVVSEASPAPAETPAPPAPDNSPSSQASASGSPSESPGSSGASPTVSPESTPEASSPAPAQPSPSPSDSANSEIPAPSPASQATPPPVVANSKEEDATRKEVLKRIDMIRELTPKEKDYLYSQVERARGFTKLAIVPYGSGQLWPDSFQSNYLFENLSKPPIAKIFEDPTVVLVMVGYSDLKGSDERNLEISRSRAENLIKLLHRKTKISNLMRAVGMGGSDLFDKTDLQKNRVVEMWIVRP
jgi:flagellar motor protein MotB